jgi:tetratricopeptide (TPR) repeat protein
MASGQVPRSSHDQEILRSLARRINPQDAGAHSNLGVVFYHKGLIEEAIAAFERALELDPLMQVAQRNLQVAYFHTGYFERLLTELQARLAADPEDLAARRRLARAYLHTDNIPAAIAEWSRLLEREPAELSHSLNLAQAEYRRGNAEAALGYLERARLQAPDDPRVQLRRGEIYYRQGRTAEARSALERAVVLDPGLAEAYHLLAFVYGDLGDSGAAVHAAGRAAKLNPSYGNAETNLSLDHYSTARYDELIGDREPEAAVGMLAHYNLGLTFRQKGLYDEAWREFTLALERGEDPLLVGQARAELQLLRGAAVEADELLLELLELDPESPKLWNERGIAAHQRGALEEADGFYRKALELDPTYALARNNLAVLQHHQGIAEAEATFRQALEGGRGLGDVWRNLGLMLARQGRRVEAVTAYRRALDLEPASAVAWTGMGAVLMDGGRLAEARAAFVRAVDLDPELAEARYHLAFALSATGDYRGALRETRRALELDPFVPTPRFRLLIDLQFEEVTILAPELDVAERVQPGDGVEEFDFRAEDLDGLFAELMGTAVPDSNNPGQESGSRVRAQDGGTPARVREALAKGQLDLAAKLAQESLLAGKDRIESLVLLGDTFLRRQLAGEALERYQAALDEGGTEADETAIALRCDALLGRTRALLILGRVAEARDGAEELCELLPGNPEALRILGQTLARAGQFDRAVEVLERGRALADDDSELATDLGLAYLETGDLAGAELELRRAIEYDGLAVAARSALGRVLERAGREEEAVAVYRAALELLPSYGEVALALAEVERRRGRYEIAIGVQVDLLTLDPYHLDILSQLGSVLLEAGRQSDASFAFQRVLRLDPEHEAARRGLAAVER